MKAEFRYSMGYNIDKEVVEASSYHGIKFAIIDAGPWPLAYIELHDSMNKEDIDEYVVHGGISYTGTAYWDENDDRLYIGWDYAHCSDYTASCPLPNTHKWTPAEVLEEVKQAIDEIYTHKWYQQQVETILRQKGCTDEDVARLLSSENTTFARNNNITPEDTAWGLLF